MTARRQSRTVRVGRLTIGGNSPIPVQSMTNTDPRDREATLSQVRALVSAGCDVVRLAAPDTDAARIFSFLKEQGVTVPLVADIHFDYKIALEAVAAGADKIRINPGNIGSRDKVAEVVRACRAAGVPIRIGVNGGSLERAILAKYGAPTAEAIAESALRHAAILESLDFYDTVISVKSSDVKTVIEANRILADRTDYPLHLGVTEAGGLKRGTVKGAIGIGTLLAEGIGDTVRVSLTANPVEEVAAAREILSALGLDPHAGIDVISCPTCGRTKIDLIPLLAAFEKGLDARGLRGKKLKVAFMGCAVNGPGEAREADLGIAGGDGEALLFRHGETVAKYPADRIVDILLDEIEKTDPN
ncbi:MAG: flavodoxin-dependent (E)-4-hydroxy-3-methylbut-2-enyl-diphosphate synthase [Clostridia bacterium]|nr:flavodoxin-dependent (E)-4-hydroxy-3-methylbut-2-enyl-diphosphate synthase [Clostridia bacterium]